ncbi:MAG: glucose dehydrogenase, partial [Gemmatimonadetes bacterium]|nr:glucose dehydrogenase [Gemmatimonadota bacterium]
MRQTLLAVMVLMVGACGGATEPEETVVAGPACDPDNGGLTLPDGFCALVAAEGLGAARHMVTAPNGDLFVADRNQGGENPVTGGVVALRDTDGDGRFD